MTPVLPGRGVPRGSRGDVLEHGQFVMSGYYGSLVCDRSGREEVEVYV